MEGGVEPYSYFFLLRDRMLSKWNWKRSSGFDGPFEVNMKDQNRFLYMFNIFQTLLFADIGLQISVYRFLKHYPNTKLL